MSTTFVLFKIPIELDEHENIITEYDESDYCIVARRDNNGIVWFYGDFHYLSYALKDDVEVYAIDNHHQGIKTIGNIKFAIKNLKR